ncbi:hypothetical protein MKX01_035922, partial [Papaver californicum]
MACPNCNKRNLWRDGKPWCQSYEKRVRNPTARYKLELKVTDSTDTVAIIALGENAKPLLNNVRIPKLMQINNFNIE